MLDGCCPERLVLKGMILVGCSTIDANYESRISNSRARSRYRLCEKYKHMREGIDVKDTSGRQHKVKHCVILQDIPTLSEAQPGHGGALDTEIANKVNFIFRVIRARKETEAGQSRPNYCEITGSRIP